MDRRTLPTNVKRTSVVRRVPPMRISPRLVAAPGLEGAVCAFELAPEALPIIVEEVSGRSMTLAPGDVFLATPGHRESTRWVVGGIPKRGLVAGRSYWVLAESGVVGDLVGGTPSTKTHLGQAKYLGAVSGGDGKLINIREFAAPNASGLADRGAPVFLVLGTSAEVGKTTAGLTVLRALLQKGHATVIALKATGTSGITEIAAYQDYGATHAFDCVDFGLPTTYPANRDGIVDVFDRALDTCLSIPADAVLIECGGDMLGANVPVFLKRLKRRRSRPKVILAAADALGALGATRMLKEMGLTTSLITGPCTDTHALRRRTEDLCRIPALNMAGRGSEGVPL
jgi:hypothetical protein